MLSKLRKQVKLKIQWKSNKYSPEKKEKLKLTGLKHALKSTLIMKIKHSKKEINNFYFNALNTPGANICSREN